MTNRTCRICGKPAAARDLCRKHYSREWRHGDPLYGENPLPYATPCVYSITCVANGWVYIGSTQSVRGRWKTHKSHLNTGRHTVPRLQADWDAFGESAFLCEIITIVHERDARLDAEQVHITAALTTGKCYNLSPNSRSNGGHRFNDEQRQRLSEAMTGKAKSAEHRANLWQDREVTDDFRERMAANGRALAGKPKSDETKSRMSVAQENRKVLTEPEAREIKRLLAAERPLSGAEIGRMFGVERSAISAIKSGRNWGHVPWPDEDPGQQALFAG